MSSILDALNPITAIADTATDIGSKIGNAFLGFKKLDYEKQMQKEAWSREDNAIQRRVADLKAAGLSPVLAAGQGAQASSPISVTQPSLEGTSMQDKLQGVMALMRQKQDIAQSAASTANIKTQEQNTLQDTLNKMKDHEIKVQELYNKAREGARIFEDTKGIALSNSEKAWNLGIAKSRGIPTGSSEMSEFLNKGDVMGKMLGMDKNASPWVSSILGILQQVAPFVGGAKKK